jgi:hypothetical protein
MTTGARSWVPVPELVHLLSIGAGEPNGGHKLISKMNFTIWNSPEVSERMWSVNFDESMSGEYQTVGGRTGRPSE